MELRHLRYFVTVAEELLVNVSNWGELNDPTPTTPKLRFGGVTKSPDAGVGVAIGVGVGDGVAFESASWINDPIDGTPALLIRKSM